MSAKAEAAIQILHIAPRVGNIGDVLSNNALEAAWRLISHQPVMVNRLDVRELYFNSASEISWETVTSSHPSQFSKIWIGGGALLDPGWKQSSSGTTINVPKNKIDSRFTLFGVGCHSSRPWDSDATSKLLGWLEAFQTRGGGLFLRDDGSLQSLRRWSGGKRPFLDTVPTVADPAFLIAYEPVRVMMLNGKHQIDANNAQGEEPYVILAPTGDEQSHRAAQYPSYSQQARALKAVLQQTDLDIKLIPHTLLDLGAMGEMVENITSLSERRRVEVVGVNWKAIDSAAIIDLYQGAEAVITSRLHGCILALALKVPVAAIVGHHALGHLVTRYGVPEFEEVDFHLNPLKTERDRWAAQIEDVGRTVFASVMAATTSPESDLP